MTDMTDDQDKNDINIMKEIEDAGARLPIDLSNDSLPLDIQIRSIALMIAQRHTGDTVVREGNLYQHLKMDNKISGPLTVDQVIYCASIFERFLWGEWSKGVAGEALQSTLDEMEEAIKTDFKDDPPTQPHSGEN